LPLDLEAIYWLRGNLELTALWLEDSAAWNFIGDLRHSFHKKT
jgi:hypothetical protein